MPYVDRKLDLSGCSSSRDDKGHRTHTLAWNVIYSEKSTDLPHIVLRQQAPQKRTQHPTDTKALCVGSGISFANWSGERGVVYKLTATYSTDVEPFANPLDEPPIVRWGYQNDTKIEEKDRFGVAILNKAGDKFENPVEVEDVIETFTYTMNLPYNPRELAKQFRNKVNDAAWLDWGAREVRCTGIDISERQTAMVPTGSEDDEKLYYWIVTASFAINENKWNTNLLEQGYRELNGAGELVDILVKDSEGNEERASFPILLDNAGAAQLVAPQVPVTTEWEVIYQTNFDDLGIETLEGF